MADGIPPRNEPDACRQAQEETSYTLTQPRSTVKLRVYKLAIPYAGMGTVGQGRQKSRDAAM